MSLKNAKFLVVASAVTLALSACASSNATEGSDGNNASPDSNQGAVDEAAAGLLPDEIRSAGTITVVGAAVPPNTMVSPDQTSITGFLPDLGDAIGERLGLTLDWKIAQFDGIIPGLESKRYDIAIADMNDNVERQQRVDFVDYITAGDTVVVLEGSPLADVTELTELCGKTVSAQVGTAPVKAAEAASKECEAKGEAPIEVQTFPDNNANVLALSSGRVDAMLNGLNFSSYLLEQQPGKFVMTPAQYNNATTGMTFPKHAPELRDAVQAALQGLMDNGTYLEILTKYGHQDRGLEKATVNGATK